MSPHRFTVARVYNYTIGTAGGFDVPTHHLAFTITVASEPSYTSKTHYLMVDYSNRVLTPDPAKLEIRQNDVVPWSTAEASCPGFAVQGGDGAKVHFDRASLPANSMYSHAFGNVGTFGWSSASDPKLYGTVTVRPHPASRTQEDRDAVVRTLAEPVLVMIDGLKVHPKKVEITLGQTVFFAVRSGADVAIIDHVLQAGNPVALNPQPLPP